MFRLLPGSGGPGRTWRPALLLCALALCSSCKDEKGYDGDMPVPSKANPPGHDLDTGKRVSALDDAVAEEAQEAEEASNPDGRNKKRGMSQEQLAAIRRTVPPFGGLDAVEPLDVLPHSRLARMVLCSSFDVKKTTAVVVRNFKDKGWVDIATHTPPRDDNRRTLTANHEDFRVTGSIYMGSVEDCHVDQGRVRISLSFQERQPSRAKLDEIDKKKLVAPLRPPAEGSSKKEALKKEEAVKKQKAAPAEPAQ